MALTTPEARAVIESLRYGIPPTGHAADFTVGRESQIRQLAESLGRPRSSTGSALLVRANYGAGKSHLLCVVREKALEAGFAVALVECDAINGVRFNRMDTMFAAVTRELELPKRTDKGLPALFETFRANFGRAGDLTLQRDISAAGRWSPTSSLSDPLLIGLRAWILGAEAHRELVTEWFAWPEAFRNRRKDLYWSLVADIEDRFVDGRREARYYMDDAFAFHTEGHEHAWMGLRDLDAIARAAGLKGLVLLFDEYEDVIQNINNRTLQMAAFRNLFAFFEGRHCGMTYFSVTPEFAERCREELMSRGVYDFPVKAFAQLPAFELAQIELDDFQGLSARIAAVHAIAFRWQPRTAFSPRAWDRVVQSAWGAPAPELDRRAIQSTVEALDQARSGRPAVA